MTDPAIVQAPWGDTVDGRRLLGEAVGFGRALRAAGLSVDLGAAVDYARSLTLVEVGDREQVRAAGEAIFVRRRDDRVIYDAVFDRWWRQRRRRHQGEFQPPALPTEEGGDDEGEGDGLPLPGEERRQGAADERGVPIPSRTEDAPDDSSPIEGVVISPDAYSQGEVIRHRDFDRMTPTELREAERLIDLLEPGS